MPAPQKPTRCSDALRRTFGHWMVQAGVAALLTLCCLGCAAGRRDSGLPEEAGTQRARALAELSGARSAGEETGSDLRSPREGSKLTSTSASEEIVPSDTRLGSTARTGAVPKDADAAKQMAEVLAELQAIGAVDPAAQERLLEDLRQIDPALWPQTIATARATIDYQRKTRSELAQSPPQTTSPPQLASPAPLSPTPSGVAQAAHLTPAASSATNSVIEPAVYRAPTSPPDNTAVIPATATATSASPNAPSPVAGPPHIPPPNTGTLESASATPAANAAPPTASPPLASPATPAAMPAGLDAAIAALVSGDQSVPPSSNSTAAAQTLEAAAARLRDAGPLRLTHLAFCTEVNSYGVYKPFEKFEFTAGQEVLLYAEVDGFKAEAQSEGFRTALSSNYEIVDAKGTTVDIRDFGLTEEVCRNRRRDYFIRYQFHLPQQLAVGTYTLRLKMTDGLSQKQGEATIDFSTKQK